MTRRREAPGARRWLAALAGVALIGGVALAPPVQQTDASWTDAEVGTATFAAATLEAPVIQGPISPCRSAPLGGDVMGVRWTFPSESEPYSGFDASNVEWSISGADWQAVPTVGPDASGYYTTTFTSDLLGGLLGSLLGSSFDAEVRTTTTTGWSSLDVSTVEYSANILGILFPPTCTFTNGV